MLVLNCYVTVTKSIIGMRSTKKITLELLQNIVLVWDVNNKLYLL